MGILVLSMLTTIACRWLIADIYYYQARAYIDSWNFSRPITQREWEIVNNALNVALNLSPDQPIYREAMSELLYYKSLFAAHDKTQAADLQKQAVEQIRKAVYLRPSWPPIWARLALIKFRTEDFDAELALALERAMALGPWEPAIQMIVAEVGLSSWTKLEPKLQAKVLDFIARTKSPQAGLIVEIAKKNDLLDVVCQRVKNLPDWKPSC